MDFGAGAVFGAINTAFKFSEFVIALNEVGSENNVFVRTIQRVRLDLEEIERLLAIESVKSVLYQNPQKTRWVKEAIFDTKTALNDIGLFVERVRSDKDRDGEIGFGNRVRWVLKDHGKIENRRSELAACHQTLTTVLASLHPLEAQLGTTQRAVSSPTMFTDDAPPPSYADAAADSDFRSPYQRKKGKMKKSEVDIVEVTQDMQEQGQVCGYSQNDPLVQEKGQAQTSTFDVMTANQNLMHKPLNLQNTMPPRPPPKMPPDPPVSLSPPFEEHALSGSNHFGPLNLWDAWVELPSGVVPTIEQGQSISSTATNMSEVKSPYLSNTATGEAPPESWQGLYSPNVCELSNSTVLSSRPEQPPKWAPTSELIAAVPEPEISSLNISELPTEICQSQQQQSKPLEMSSNSMNERLPAIPSHRLSYVDQLRNRPTSRLAVAINTTTSEDTCSEGKILASTEPDTLALRPSPLFSRNTYPSPYPYSDGMTPRPRPPIGMTYHSQEVQYRPYAQSMTHSITQEPHPDNSLISPSPSFVSLVSTDEFQSSTTYKCNTYRPYSPNMNVAISEAPYSTYPITSPAQSTISVVSNTQNTYRPFIPTAMTPVMAELSSTATTPPLQSPPLWLPLDQNRSNARSLTPTVSRRRNGLRDAVLGLDD